MGSYQDCRLNPNTHNAIVQNDGSSLTDNLLVVFHQACDERNFDVALHLLVILEERVSLRDTEYNEHTTTQGLARAHSRLKHLRNTLVVLPDRNASLADPSVLRSPRS